MLELRNIEKKYIQDPVLRISSFQFDKGINWIKGVNGSGKTTLLKLVAGLLRFNGDIVYNEISLKSEPLRYRRNVGWSEAEPLFPSFMSGMNLIFLYRSIRKVPQKEVDRLTALFKMNDYLSDPIEAYSAGMVKKLSLCLAFLGDPPVITLDEPFITLDTEALASVSSFIQEKQKNDKTIFLLSSHQEPDTRLLPDYRKFIVKDKCILPE